MSYPFHPIVFVDVETGGLDPKIHSLLTLGATAVTREGIRESRSWKVKSRLYNVDPDAMAVNKIDLLDLKANGMPLDQVAYEFRVFVKQYDLTVGTPERPKALRPRFGGHNAQFDLSFIDAAFGGGNAFHHEQVDTKGIASFLRDAGVIGDGGMSLGALYARTMGKVLENAHDAAADAYATAELYLALKSKLEARPALPENVRAILKAHANYVRVPPTIDVPPAGTPHTFYRELNDAEERAITELEMLDPVELD